MSGTRRWTRSRGLGLVIAAAAASFGIGLAVMPPHASAQGIPEKSCTDQSTSDGTAKAGDVITCQVFIDVLLTNGASFTIQPTAPTGAFITSCKGVTNVGEPPYSTTVTYSGTAGTPGYTCTFTVSTTIALGHNEIGTEKVMIPAGTAAGTSVTQQIQECGLSGAGCGPFTPMGVSGPGSCVGGSAIPVLGGCNPLPIGGSPSPSPTSAGSNTPTPSPTGQVQSAHTTPFTGGPPHPFPVAATALAAMGALLALIALAGPALLRRLRRGERGV